MLKSSFFRTGKQTEKELGLYNEIIKETFVFKPPESPVCCCTVTQGSLLSLCLPRNRLCEYHGD